MTLSTRLGITELATTQEGRAATTNEAIAKLESGAFMFAVKGINQNTPPGSPVEGDVYGLGASPTGTWAGKAKNIARYYNAAWLFIPPFDGMIANDVSVDRFYHYNGTSWLGYQPFEMVVAASDETTAILTGTAKVTFRMPRAATLTEVRASLKTAQTSGSLLTVDIKNAGSSILSTLITLDNTEKTSVTAATLPVISSAALADDAEITIDVTQIGNGTAVGLKIALIGYRT